MNNIMMSKKKMTAEVVRMHARNVLVSVDEADYEEALNCMRTMHAYIFRAMEDKRKVKLIMELNAHSISGRVSIQVYTMDCDHMEEINMVWIPATVEEYDKLASDLAHNAEGPWRLTMLTMNEAEKFMPRSHDILAEAAGY